MTRPATDDERAKTVLAVRDRELGRRLEALLRSEGIAVERVSGERLARSGAAGADLVVLWAEGPEAAGLSELLRRAREGDAPGVVVLGDGPAEDEVRLVAAGARAVLVGEPVEALAAELAELAEASASIASPRLADFRSRSPRMRDFVDLVRRVAATPCTLLVTGETGVGKERLARAIHAESGRAAGPFVVVDCGALAEGLLESELFGHEKGAFTGATSERPGCFQAADGGTILLDEVGEMPRQVQVELLGVLERQEVQPVGASRPVAVDARVIAATNRDLAADVAAGRFREDLFFRLNVVSLVIPPLRERLEDLPWLVGRFLRHLAAIHDREDVVGFSRAAMERLLAYGWPGNVRELVNVVERAVLLCEGPEVRPEDLPDSVRAGVDAVDAPAGEPAGELLRLPLHEARRRMVERFERRYLDRILDECHGAVGEVARRAAINPRTLYEKMRRLGLRKEDYRA